MAESRTMVETIACHSQFLEPVKKGFDYCWTIDGFPRISTWSTPLCSPVFEALSHNWTLEMKFHSVYQRRTDFQNASTDKYIHISLNLVDKNGEKIAETPSDTIFHLPGMHAQVLFFNENDEILMPEHTLNIYGSLAEKLNKVMGSVSIYNETRSRSGKTVQDSTTTELWKLIEGGNKEAQVKVLFELRVEIEKEKFVHKKPSPGIRDSNAGKKMLDEEKLKDFTIRTGDGQEIRAHRAILHATSDYFKAMFDLGGIETEKGEIEVPESYKVMNELIRFLYTGKLSDENAEEEDNNVSVMEMFIAADKYQIAELKEHYEGVFDEAVDTLFSPESVCAELAQAHIGGIECVKEKAVEYIRAHRKSVVKTEGWVQLCAAHPALVAYVFAP